MILLMQCGNCCVMISASAVGSRVGKLCTTRHTDLLDVRRTDGSCNRHCPYLDVVLVTAPKYSNSCTEYGVRRTTGTAANG